MASEIDIAAELQAVKKELKLWERDFEKKNGRAPTKDDMRTSSDIYAQYKDYSRLKSQVSQHNTSVKQGIVNCSSREYFTGLSKTNHRRDDKTRKPLRDLTNVGSGVHAPPQQCTRSSDSCLQPKLQKQGSPPTLANETLDSKHESQPYLPGLARAVCKEALQVKDRDGHNNPPSKTVDPYKLHRPGRFHYVMKNSPTKDSYVMISQDSSCTISASGSVPYHTEMRAHSFSRSETENDRPLCSTITSERGFVIRMHRNGMQEKAERTDRNEPLPAGFYASTGPSSLIEKKFKSCFTNTKEACLKDLGSTADFPSSKFQDDFDLDNHGKPASNEEALNLDKETVNTPQPLPTAEFENCFKDIKVVPSRSRDDEQCMSKDNQSSFKIAESVIMSSAKLSSVSNSHVADPYVSSKNVVLNSSAEIPIEQRTENKNVNLICTSKQNNSVKKKSLKVLKEGRRKLDEVCAVDQVTSDRSQAPMLDYCSAGDVSIVSLRRITRSMKISSVESSASVNHCKRSREGAEATTGAERSDYANTSGKPSARTLVQQGQRPRLNAGSHQCGGSLSSSAITDLSKSSPVVVPLPEPPSIEDQHKPAKRSKNLKSMTQKVDHESSWGNPKVLQKTSGACWHKYGVKLDTDLKHPLQLGGHRQGERNNFVKLNINGKGRRRKFTNGIRTKRPGPYGRRKFSSAKSQRRLEQSDAVQDGLAITDMEASADAMGKPGKKKCFEATLGQPSLWMNDGWLDPAVSAEHTSEQTIPDKLKNSVDKDLPSVMLLKTLIPKVQQDPSDENLLEMLRLMFGFMSFRPGQMEAIRRVLLHHSTMVMLPTGAGKSLCYQLPAYLLPGITLVISPLMALMADQLFRLPPALPGALISSAQTACESSDVIARLRAGKLKVLFISPERLFSQSFLSVLGEIPKIELAVVDEAHCLSEWSHNFRSSYFRLGSILNEQLKVPCILAMTATATKKAEMSILNLLRIPSDGVVQAESVRSNIQLSISSPKNKLKALLSLLQASPLSDAQAIVYCTFQMDADNVSNYLERNGILAKSYHGGKLNQDRKRIHQLFCSNKLRVVVATVAFGLGLDKSDVRGIIHYNMPRSLEHYVQETGRAGRDGNPAYCHLFLDDEDYLKLRSLSHSDGVDEVAVNKLLCRVFGETSTAMTQGPSSIIIETAAQELDIKEEVMETVLSYLEGEGMRFIKVLSKMNATCSLSFHKKLPTVLAQQNTLVAAILERGREKHGCYVFNLPSLASHAQVGLPDIQSELRRLLAAGEVRYELSDPALCFSVVNVPEDICRLTSTITARLADVEQCKVKKLDAMFVASNSANALEKLEAKLGCEGFSTSQQIFLQSTIKSYFEDDGNSTTLCDLPNIIKSYSSFLQADLKVFLSANRHVTWTGRAVARIFHGLWSPAFPYTIWSKNHFWAKYTTTDFNVIRKCALKEILAQHASH